MRIVCSSLVLFALALVAWPVSAHEEFRIIGTLTRVQDTQIDVRTRDSKTIAVKLDKQTVVTRDKKKVAVTQLKSGQSVVVDALGDDESDLLALEVRIVPAIVRPGAK